MRLLLVEDDRLLGDGIQSGLVQRGYSVDWVKNGEDAEAALLANEYGLVVLDLGLPKISGIEVLKWLRRQGKETPVLILTALDAVEERVAGLDAGGDDYLVKPFHLDELAARLRALNRRSQGSSQPLFQVGDLEFNPSTLTVRLAGQVIEFSRTELMILQALMENPERVLSRDQLEHRLYAWGQEIESNVVEVHIHHIRKKLGSDWIKNIRGVGYMLARPAKNGGGT